MVIQIRNCNNITNGEISIVEGRLNIKYAINGTGKSTIAKAIKSAIEHDETSLRDLLPYRLMQHPTEDQLPSVSGLPDDLRIAVFDEEYVEKYVFLEDDLLKDSFDIFVKTNDYEQRLAEINGLIAGVKTIFEDNPDLDGFISDMKEFIAVFGNSRTGIANNGALVRGMQGGNVIQNIPQELEGYSAFLTDAQNSKWLKWQATGRSSYMQLSDKCPFCAGELAPQRDKIDRIATEYDSKTVEHLSKILDLFERLGHYFDAETNVRVRTITMNVHGLSDEQKAYLVEIKNQVQTLFDKLTNLKRMGFDSLKDIDRIAVAVPQYKIDMQYLSHLNSDYTNSRVAIVNDSIDTLNGRVGQLQGAINRQKREIEDTVRNYNAQINEFLANAGYSYTVSIDEAEDHSYKLKLKFGEGTETVTKVRSHLSYGERNAFALVLFMYQAIHQRANLIILDDPISSFDKNKKFAILDMLFIRGGSFRGKTSLMLTHDFEPVIDAVYNHPSFFEGTPQAAFLQNDNGSLSERIIQKENILSSVQVADENIRNATNAITKAIFLRRKTEIIYGKTMAWHLLSNLFHKREIPTIGNDAMTEAQITEALDNIRNEIPDFDYAALLARVTNQDEIVALYRASNSNYEKLQLYRILFDATEENHPMRKFINETYHVENDYLFQLNPLEFSTIPDYIIRQCDQAFGLA